jgi:hypothetical protein
MNPARIHAPLPIHDVIKADGLAKSRKTRVMEPRSPSKKRVPIHTKTGPLKAPILATDSYLQAIFRIKLSRKTPPPSPAENT